MRLLIIDDDDCKIDRVKRALQQIKTIIILDVARSRNEGLRKIIDSSLKYDGLILDMQFPIHGDDFEIDTEAGISVLRELQRKKISIPTIMYSSIHRCV